MKFEITQYMYQLSDYDYNLPDERIAQHPISNRQCSRLLVMDRKTGDTSHHLFHDIVGMLSSGDVLVVNDTRVIPARLEGHKPSGGKTEVLLIDYAGGIHTKKDHQYVFECKCLLRSSKNARIGTEIRFSEGLTAHVRDQHGGGVYTISFSSGEPFEKVLEKQGKIPLPPYIDRNKNPEAPSTDKAAYQTVYAANDGAVAAPTAGLHFTAEIMAGLEKKGIEICYLTLHVSYGTFMPVREEDIRKHVIHTERYVVSEKTAATINTAKASGRRIVAAGTTSVRTLEYIADQHGRVSTGSGSCDLFIYPGYRFKIVDQMITNFHLPKSTLLMLVSAFSEKNAIFNAYQVAIQEKYRFFSYGDAMFIR